MRKQIKKFFSFILVALLAFPLLPACETEESAECVHDFKQYVAKAPSCETAGILEKHCSKCGKKEFSEIEAIGAHNFIDGLCGVCGKQENPTPENSTPETSTPETSTPETSEPETTEPTIQKSGWTYEDIYETAKTWSLGEITEEKFKNSLKETVLTEMYVGELGQFYATRNKQSAVLPDIRSEYEWTGEKPTEYISVIEIKETRLLVTTADGERNNCGILQALSTETTGKQITEVLIDKQNVVVVGYNDGSATAVGLIATDLLQWDNSALVYEKVGNEYAVVGALNKKTQTVVVPLTHKGLPVSIIGEDAFSHYENLELVDLSNSQVKTIEKEAFFNCAKLQTVTLNEGLSYIGSMAFSSCIRLNWVIIPQSVTRIAGHAFSMYTKVYAKVASQPQNWSSYWHIGEHYFSNEWALVNNVPQAIDWEAFY